jgi:hypothetical protein
MMLGPKAHLCAWSECIPKCLQAVYAMRRFGLGFIATIYNLYCFAKLLYIAQLYGFSFDILHAEKRVLLIIQAVPAGVLTYGATSHLKILFFPVQPATLQHAGVAAMIRASSNTSNNFQLDLALMSHDRGVEQQLGPTLLYMKHYFDNCIPRQITRVLIRLDVISRDFPIFTESQPANMQHLLIGKFYELSDFCPLRFLSHKLAKFSSS